VAAVALACFALAALPALAQTSSDMFKLEISEKEKAISDPTNTALQNFLMHDLGADRMIARNMPYLELTNLDPDFPLMEFHASIGDSRFHFDCDMLQACAMISSAPAGIRIESSVIPTADDDPSLLPGDVLILNFDNGGLAPGESVRFKIALGVDDGYDFFHRPDYRTILFDMNGMDAYGGNVGVPTSMSGDSTADNSQLTAMYGTGGTPYMMAYSALIDYPVMGEAANYYNNHYRPYGIMEHVDTFLALGQASEIPEPSAAMLAIVGVFGGLALRSRSRRRATRTP